MKFLPTKIDGVWIVEMERHSDNRGWFAQTWTPKEFAANGVNSKLANCSVSFNLRRGTMRGMHYQIAPHQEAKLVRCTRGAIFDVALDLRPDSPTFKRSIGTELTADNGRALYISEGHAHGFQTLLDDTEVLYLISEDWHPESAHGVRWDDPAFKIYWPLTENLVLSPRDATWPNFGG
jgi:dTDP-4-dehydrorhamnose 3,5-epimerase